MAPSPCLSPEPRDSGGLSRNASAPALPGWAQRPWQRQLLPPLEGTKSPPLLPVKSPGSCRLQNPLNILNPPDPELLSKRHSRRMKTFSVLDQVSDAQDDDAPVCDRKPRRCKTSGASAELAAHCASLVTTPLSTPGGSALFAMSPQLSTATPTSCCAMPASLSRVDGQEGVAWVRGSRLGSGSYGTVYKAMDRSSGRMFAVKELVLGDADSKNRERLESELSICRNLRHHNIVSYLGHAFTDEFLYIFLEYVPGGSMASMLGEFGPLSDAQLLRKATTGMLEGLNYLHTQNPPVVHRDIKAANLLVDLDLHVKLADFGCSKCSTETQSFTTVGSVPWMAPEVMLLEGGHGRKADIWSVGCTILELATAENPWGKNAFDNLMYAMQVIAFSNTTPPIPESLHPEAKEMVAKCVNRIAPERPSASELLDNSFIRGSRGLAWGP